MNKTVKKSMNTDKKVTVELTKTQDEILQDLKKHFIKATDSINADKSAVIKYFLGVDDKEILKTIALLDYSRVSTWELINANLTNNNESSNDYLLADDDQDSGPISTYDLLTDELLNKLPKISLDQCFIHTDKLISNDMVVALDGVYTNGETRNTSVGKIKFNYGIGNIVIPLAESNKAILIGTLVNIVTENKTCFVPSNETIDRELTSDLHNSKKTNLYKRAKDIAIANWCHETNVMKQVKKARLAQIERNSRSDFYQQSLRLRG